MYWACEGQRVWWMESSLYFTDCRHHDFKPEWVVLRACDETIRISLEKLISVMEITTKDLLIVFKINPIKLR